MRGLGSIPTGGNIFQWIFLFSRSKVSVANIGIFARLKPVLGNPGSTTDLCVTLCGYMIRFTILRETLNFYFFICTSYSTKY